MFSGTFVLSPEPAASKSIKSQEQSRTQMTSSCLSFGESAVDILCVHQHHRSSWIWQLHSITLISWFVFWYWNAEQYATSSGGRNCKLSRLENNLLHMKLDFFLIAMPLTHCRHEWSGMNFDFYFDFFRNCQMLPETFCDAASFPVFPSLV